MKLNADQLETLESYTAKEIEQELVRWQEAARLKAEWDKLTEEQRQEHIDRIY